MLAFRLVTYFCAAFLLAIVAVVAYRTVTLPRPDRIAYVRNFKKGKCAIVYVVAVPLFLINNLHVGKTFFEALLDGISKAIYLIALKYDTSSVAALAGVLPEFRVTVYVCLVIVILNALMFAFSVFHQSVWEVLSRRAFVRGVGTKCIVIGATAAGRAIYKSCPTKKMIVGDLSAAEREKLFAEELPACFRLICDSQGLQNESEAQRIEKIVQYIDDHLMDSQLGVAALVNEFKVSAPTLQKMIRMKTNMTLAAYVDERRLALAVRMLTESPLSISEISTRCGYGSVNSFYKAFKRRHGVAPSAMQRMNKEENPEDNA